MKKSGHLIWILGMVWFSQLAWAGDDSFSGFWQGEGKAVMKPDSAHPHSRSCSDIVLEFSQKSDLLSLLQGYYRCEDLKAAYDPAALEIRDGILFESGKEIGTIDSEGLRISIPDPEDGSTFSLRLRKDAGALDYLEEWIQGGRVQLRVIGRLGKASPIDRLSSFPGEEGK